MQDENETIEGAPATEAPPAAPPPQVEAPPTADAAPARDEARAEEGARPAPDRPRAGGEGGEGPERGRGGGDGRRRHFGRRKICIFCVEHATSIDYKDSAKLRRYLSDRARIDARRKTGTCAKHQRWLAQALKRARHLALLPYTPEHMRVSGISTGRR